MACEGRLKLLQILPSIFLLFVGYLFMWVLITHFTPTRWKQNGICGLLKVLILAAVKTEKIWKFPWEIALILDYTEPGNRTTNSGPLLFLESVYIFRNRTLVFFATILQKLPSGFPLGSEAFNQYAKKPTCFITRPLAAVFTTSTEQHSVWQLTGIRTSVVRLREEHWRNTKILGSTCKTSWNVTVEDLQACFCSLLISDLLKCQVKTFPNRGRKRVMERLRLARP